MTLRLTIENETSLPDGGPIEIAVSGKRGIDIGRDQHLDWVLPDPGRFISGKHCEIRYRDGGYYLHDVSRNGTFMNGEERRLQAPYRLRHGDRVEIGKYIIAVSLVDEEDAPDGAGGRGMGGAPKALWDVDDAAAPPVHAREVITPKPAKGAHAVDMLDWRVELQAPIKGAPIGEPADPWNAAIKPPAAPGAAPEFAPRPMPAGRSRPPAEAARAPADEVQPEPRRAAASVPPPGGGGMPDAGEFIRRFALGAGIPPQALLGRDPGEIAELFGQVMRIATERLRELLIARAQTKGAMRSANQTMIQAVDNNPLRFAPTTEEALKIIFGPSSQSYLDAKRTFETSFRDLKAHQVDTFSAMQQALKELLGEFDPKSIEASAGSDRGIGAMLSSRKARLWDIYVALWQAKTDKQDDGLLGAFMRYFSEHYDRRGDRG